MTTDSHSLISSLKNMPLKLLRSASQSRIVLLNLLGHRFEGIACLVQLSSKHHDQTQKWVRSSPFEQVYTWTNSIPP